MAKKERELSPAEKKASDIRVKLDAAKEKDGKSSTDATKKAVADLETELKAQNSIVNRERFVRVGNSRTKKAIAAIGNIGNVAAPRSYTYTSADVDVIEKLLTERTASTVGKLRNAITKGASAAKDDTVIFTA